MTIGPTQILDIGRKALFAHQYALAVTAHNVANVNTPGYSRQRVIFTPTILLHLPPGPVGTGVFVSRIERVRYELADAQVRDQLSQVGEWQKQDELLKQIESILNEPSATGLATMITDFFNAWMDVSNNPEESGPRTVLVESAQILSSTFHRLRNQLYTMVTNLNEEVAHKVEDINLKATQIAELNKQIVSNEAGGQSANDLRDARDRLVDELSQLADIQTVEAEDGSLTVYINYKVIVDRGNVVELQTEMVERHGMKMLDIMYQDERLFPESGELHGILKIRDNEVPEYIDGLDELAKTIIEEVNNLHRSGYGLDGSTGKDFFQGEDAFDISVHSEIIANIYSIAASASGAPGDGANALLIADLAQALSMEGNFTFSDFYRSLVAKIGARSWTARTMLENEQTLLTQIENYRDSISGVSLEEEFTNMINYQHAFEAASKVIQTADSIFATLVEMI